jgi:hypothetical protein
MALIRLLDQAGTASIAGEGDLNTEVGLLSQSVRRLRGPRNQLNPPRKEN